jgi:hypothetical protein
MRVNPLAGVVSTLPFLIAVVLHHKIQELVDRYAIRVFAVPIRLGGGRELPEAVRCGRPGARLVRGASSFRRPAPSHLIDVGSRGLEAFVGRNGSIVGRGPVCRLRKTRRDSSRTSIGSAALSLPPISVCEATPVSWSAASMPVTGIPARAPRASMAFTGLSFLPHLNGAPLEVR